MFAAKNCWRRRALLNERLAQHLGSGSFGSGSFLKVTERFTVAAEGAVPRRCAEKVHHRAADRSRANRSDAQHSRTSIDCSCSPLIFASQRFLRARARKLWTPR